MLNQHPSSGSASLAMLLLRLRSEQGLSMSALARKSGMTKSALSSWETGSRRPSGPNLECVLDALQVAPGQKAVVLAHAAPAHARDALVGSPLGAPIGQPDLFRAMRLRVGLSQSEVGVRLGVSQSAVAKWESGESLLDREQRENLFDTLEATVEERSQFDRLARDPAPTIGSPDEAWSRIDLIMRTAPLGLRDVLWTLLASELWRSAVSDARYEPIFIAVLEIHAIHLKDLLRYEEAVTLAKRAVRMAVQTDNCDHALWAQHICTIADPRKPLDQRWALRSSYRDFSEKLHHPLNHLMLDLDLRSIRTYRGGSYGLRQREYLLAADGLANHPAAKPGLYRWADQTALVVDHVECLVVAGAYEEALFEVETHLGHRLGSHTVGEILVNPSRIANDPSAWAMMAMYACARIELGEPVPETLWSELRKPPRGQPLHFQRFYQGMLRPHDRRIKLS